MTSLCSRTDLAARTMRSRARPIDGRMRFVLPVFQCRLAETSRIESGQERRGAAARIGGGYIGNVTTPEASLSREGICGSVDSRGSLAGRNRNLALQLRGSAGLAPAFPTRISRHTTRLPSQVNRRWKWSRQFGILILTRGGGVGCSNMAASRSENRENGSADLRDAWVAGAADILFGCQALSFGKRYCELAGFDVAAVSRIGSA